MDDLELLKAYADHQDQDAFSQLVRRHGNWLYSAARRQLGDGQLAEDAAQAVFLLLARRAKGLRHHTYLSGWLFRALGYCVRETTRHRARLEKREREAATMRPETMEPDANWDEIAPILEQAVARLPRGDRDAVLLRFYEQRPLAEVGRLLGVSEEAARKRVDRAVEKLRGSLERRGVTETSAGLSAVLVGNVVQEVPARVVEGVMSAVGGGGSAVAGGIAKGAMKMMTVAKVKVAAVVIGAVLVTGGVVAAVAETATTRDSAPSAADPPPSLNADSAQKLMMAMSQQERLDYLIRALKQREAELQRVSLSFTEFVGNMRAPEARADKYFRSSIQTDVTIDGPRRLIRSKEFNDDNVLLKDSLISYNGARRRSLDNYHVVEIKNFRVVTHPSPGNIIDDPESQAMRSPFYHMLGNQVINGHRAVEGRVVFVAMPISEALSQLPWDVQLSQEEGVPVVTATFKTAGGKMIWDYVWTFDLSKNWMPKRYMDRTIAGPAKTYALYEVTEARNVDGLFLPWRITCRGSTDSPELTFSGDASVEVTAAARGRRLDDGFEVVFLPGTIVADGVAGVAYRMREGGGADQLSDDELAAALGCPPGTVTIKPKRGLGIDKMK